jgi:hypothetical protein
VKNTYPDQAGLIKREGSGFIMGGIIPEKKRHGLE